jgi:hypothetical protein
MQVSNVGSPMTNVDYQFNESMFLQVHNFKMEKESEIIHIVCFIKI